MVLDERGGEEVGDGVEKEVEEGEWESGKGGKWYWERTKKNDYESKSDCDNEWRGESEICSVSKQ